MSPIKELSLTYEDINTDRTFSEGDILTGLVSFNLTKETKVKRITVKLKGDTNVRWTKIVINGIKEYSAHARYFKLKTDLLAEDDTDALLPRGINSFNFSFQIPHHAMPSSFRGKCGQIVYHLEAKVSRSWRCPSTTKTEISFVSKSLQFIEQAQQTGSVNKDIGLFSKSQVQLTATVNKSVCSPGDTVSIVANIQNSSSKKLRPKFTLRQETEYRVGTHTNTGERILCKGLGNTIDPNSSQSVSCQMMIPHDAPYTLHNCVIISVQYHIKVYLDISFAPDPEVQFPLFVVPSRFITLSPSEDVGSYGPYPTRWPKFCLPFSPC